LTTALNRKCFMRSPSQPQLFFLGRSSRRSNLDWHS
jgi:hypothetical protein